MNKVIFSVRGWGKSQAMLTSTVTIKINETLKINKTFLVFIEDVQKKRSQMVAQVVNLSRKKNALEKISNF